MSEYNALFFSSYFSFSLTVCSNRYNDSKVNEATFIKEKKLSPCLSSPHQKVTLGFKLKLTTTLFSNPIHLKSIRPATRKENFHLKVSIITLCMVEPGIYVFEGFNCRYGKDKYISKEPEVLDGIVQTAAFKVDPVSVNHIGNYEIKIKESNFSQRIIEYIIYRYDSFESAVDKLKKSH